MSAARLPTQRSPVEEYRLFARTRLVALDIDGTVSRYPDERLADQIYDLGGALKRSGVTLTLATGRAFLGARPIIDVLLRERTVPVILYNGGVIADASGRSIAARSTISARTAELAVRLALSAGFTVLAYECSPSQGGMLPADGGGIGLVEAVTGWGEPDEGLPEPNGLGVQWRKGEDLTSMSPPTAILVSITGKSDALLWLRENLRGIPDISVTTSGRSFLEIRPMWADKGRALAWIAAARGLTPDSVVAVGDNDNDVEMLKWAGCGVAVANASVPAREAADYISECGAAEGVIEVLRVIAHACRFFRGRGTTPLPKARIGSNIR